MVPVWWLQAGVLNVLFGQAVRVGRGGGEITISSGPRGKGEINLIKACRASIVFLPDYMNTLPPWGEKKPITWCGAVERRPSLPAGARGGAGPGQAATSCIVLLQLILTQSLMLVQARLGGWYSASTITFPSAAVTEWRLRLEED